MNWFFAAAALALLLWFFALLYLRSFVRQRTDPDYILGLLREEVHQLEAAIDAKTEGNLQLLEEKMRTLRELCAEVERRIVVYGREIEKREKESQTLAVLNQGGNTPTKKRAGKPRTEPLKIVVSRESPVVSRPPLKDRIAELHLAGFSTGLIAKQVGLTPGEVTMYINMAEKPSFAGKQKKSRR